MKRTLLLLPLTLLGLAATGCYSSVGYYRRYPPPPPRVEYYGVAPGPGFVWVSGYWRPHGNNYRWVNGHWARRGYR